MGAGPVSMDPEVVVEVAADLVRAYDPGVGRGVGAGELAGVDDRVRSVVASLRAAEGDLTGRMAEGGRLLARRATSAVEDVRRADR